MVASIPLQCERTTRFLASGGKRLLVKRIWNLKDAISTDRLAIFTHSRSYSLHHPLSLRYCLPLSHTSFSPLLRPCSPYLRSSLMTSPHAAADNGNPPHTKTVRVVVKGRVQGVFYRNWTIENATQLGLKGWVRNRRDGTVEALFSGNPDSVQDMEQRCRRGPPDAMVTGLDVFPSNDDPGTGFERKPTI
ncbi:Acylphosphatase [Melia azedarach]|uniref:Acylphosphatase n=1 Tax=Melia azedarach TaxID=155640 RepID=A0ACC1X1P7_MELAZ|nr:Acylphosphatase [Melia azedarach]